MKNREKKRERQKAKTQSHISKSQNRPTQTTIERVEVQAYVCD